MIEIPSHLIANSTICIYMIAHTWEIVKALPFIHQPGRVAPKASDVSAADWLYQQTWKNTIFFHLYCYGFSRSRKSLYNTAVYVIKSFYLNTHNMRCYMSQNHHVPDNKLYLIKVLRRSFHLNGQTPDCHPHQARITWDSRFKKKKLSTLRLNASYLQA